MLETKNTRNRLKIAMASLLLVIVAVQCASKKLSEYTHTDTAEMNKEYEKMVKIAELPKPPEENVPTAEAEKTAIENKTAENAPPKKDAIPEKKPVEKMKAKASLKKAATMEKRQPQIEDAEGFIGRRPIEDPYRVGEKIEMSVTYFNMAAGILTLEVKPFVEVNSRKSYHFNINIESSSMFAYFYTVSDQVETFMDYEELTPSSYSVKIDESKQIKDIRSFFNFKTLKGTYWEKKVTKEKGEEYKKKEWTIEAYTQNVMSVLFYLRFFKMTPGKELSFRVSDAGENMLFTAKVLRKEKLKTEIGVLDTVVLQPQIAVGGIFKQMGDIFIWLTDDERKIPVRIDSKIKIGTLITKIKSIKK